MTLLHCSLSTSPRCKNVNLAERKKKKKVGRSENVFVCSIAMCWWFVGHAMKSKLSAAPPPPRPHLPSSLHSFPPCLLWSFFLCLYVSSLLSPCNSCFFLICRAQGEKSVHCVRSVHFVCHDKLIQTTCRPLAAAKVFCLV